MMRISQDIVWKNLTFIISFQTSMLKTVHLNSNFLYLLLEVKDFNWNNHKICMDFCFYLNPNWYNLTLYIKLFICWLVPNVLTISSCIFSNNGLLKSCYSAPHFRSSSLIHISTPLTRNQIGFEFGQIRLF